MQDARPECTGGDEQKQPLGDGEGQQEGAPGQRSEEGQQREVQRPRMCETEDDPEPGQGWGALWLGSLVLGLLICLKARQALTTEDH